MADAHRTPAFQNAVTYTVAVTVTVRGGVRRGTADRRALKVAERLADAAARAADVVEVTATAGRSHDGNVHSPRPVRFAAANTGSATSGSPPKLDRYLDPDHERALRSLAEANAAYRQRQRADRERRQQVGCRNHHAVVLSEHVCGCVYCAPGRHLDSIQARRRSPGNPLVERYCLCGQNLASTVDRCPRHRAATVIVLDGDDPALRLVADALDRRHDTAPQRDRRPEPRRRDQGLGR